MGSFLLPRIAFMRRKRVIECLAIIILSMGRQMRLHRYAKLFIGPIGMTFCLARGLLGARSIPEVDLLFR